MLHRIRLGRGPHRRGDRGRGLDLDARRTSTEATSGTRSSRTRTSSRCRRRRRGFYGLNLEGARFYRASLVKAELVRSRPGPRRLHQGQGLAAPGSSARTFPGQPARRARSTGASTRRPHPLFAGALHDDVERARGEGEGRRVVRRRDHPGDQICTGRPAGARFGGAKLGPLRLPGADLYRDDCGARSCSSARSPAPSSTAAICGGAKVFGGRLRGASLAGANLAEAQLLTADLVDVNLSGANLRGTQLIGARLDGADLSFARLEGRGSTARASATPTSTRPPSPPPRSRARTSPAPRSNGARIVGSSFDGQPQGADLDGATIGWRRPGEGESAGRDAPKTMRPTIFDEAILRAPTSPARISRHPSSRG